MGRRHVSAAHCPVGNFRIGPPKVHALRRAGSRRVALSHGGTRLRRERHRGSALPQVRPAWRLEAIALFVYRVVRELGSLIAALGGIDGLVFSAGIGEHDALTRAEVVEGSRPERSSIRSAPRAATSGSAPTTRPFRSGLSHRRGTAHCAPYRGAPAMKATTAPGLARPPFKFRNELEPIVRLRLASRLLALRQFRRLSRQLGDLGQKVGDRVELRALLVV